MRAIVENLGLPRRVRTWPLREGRSRALKGKASWDFEFFMKQLQG